MPEAHRVGRVIRLPSVLVALVLLAASLLLAAPAESATSPWRGVLTFDKNWQNPANSRLTWQLLQRQSDGTWKTVEKHYWRSGSGMLGRAGRNSCVNNQGWLPNGTYAMRQYDNYGGNLIKGRAFRLDDKRCASGNGRSWDSWPLGQISAACARARVSPTLGVADAVSASIAKEV